MSLMLDPSPTLPVRLLLLFPSVLLDDLDFDDAVDDAIDFSDRFFWRALHRHADLALGFCCAARYPP